MGDFHKMDDEDREMVVEETEHMVRDLMDELLVKVMWDIVITLVNPCDETRDRIINAIGKVAVDKVRDDMAEDSAECDADDLQFCNDIADEAIKRAFEKFQSNLTHTILTDDFLMKVVTAFSTNVCRLSVDKDKPEE